MVQPKELPKLEEKPPEDLPEEEVDDGVEGGVEGGVVGGVQGGVVGGTFGGTGTAPKRIEAENTSSRWSSSADPRSTIRRRPWKKRCRGRWW